MINEKQLDVLAQLLKTYVDLAIENVKAKQPEAPGFRPAGPEGWTPIPEASPEQVRKFKEAIAKYPKGGEIIACPNPEPHISTWSEEDVRTYERAIHSDDYAKLKKRHANKRGDDITLGALLVMVLDSMGDKRPLPMGQSTMTTAFKFAKVVRDLTKLELQNDARARIQTVDNGEGKEAEAVILWPSLSDDYIYVPKNYTI